MLTCPGIRDYPSIRERALQSTYAAPIDPTRCLRLRVRAEKTVRCQRSVGIETDRGSTDLARREMGRVPGADSGRAGQQETCAGLDCAVERRHSAADHA